jgi:hypothetical protein
MQLSFKSAIQAAMLTTALLAASILPAHAGFLITSATRSVLAETAISPTDVKSATSTSGVFNELVNSLGGSDPEDETAPAASASQESAINSFASLMEGRSRVFASGDGATLTNSLSTFSMLFTIDSTFEFSGVVSLRGNPTIGVSALFDLFEINADGSSSSVFSGTDLTTLPDTNFGGFLDSGNYGLTVSARATTSNVADTAGFGNGGGFTFLVHFIEGEPEPVDPPNGVPEPGSLALMLAGALASGVVTKRRAAKSPFQGIAMPTANS